jgi:REase_AHJR-like
MTANPAEHRLTRGEARLLELLRGSYEDDGFTFVEHPGDANLPPFMKGYRPDALALRDDKSIAIELKVRREPAKEKYLRAISERFKDQPKWEFRVIYGGQLEEEPISAPTVEQIQAHIAEAETLLAQNHPRAALVLGWAAIEGIARTLSPDFPSRGSRTMRQAVELLEHLGRLRFQDAQELRKLLPLRSRVVHGDFGARITSVEVEPVLKAAREALAAT